ncbi:MAG: tetratricopeptide repeat protein [Limisphaerales bacterium]
MLNRSFRTELAVLALPALTFALWARAETLVFPEFTVASAQSYLEAQSKEFEDRAGTDADTLFLLARLQNRLGDQNQAERLARQASEHDLKRPDIYSFLGRVYLSEGRLEEAAAAFRKTLELNPKAAGDCRRLGMVLDQLGDHQGARKAFLSGLDLAPNDAVGQLMLGRSLLDHGEAKEAIDHLEKACQLDGTSVNAFYVLAQAQRQIGDHAAAQQTLQTFQRLRVNDKADLMAQDASYDNEKEMRRIALEFHLDAADFFLRRRRIDLAEAHLKQATVVAPDDAQAYEVLARMYLAGRRELPIALAFSRRCASLQPTAAHYDVLALACEANGLRNEARQAVDQAVRLEPGNAVYLKHQQRLNQNP